MNSIKRVALVLLSAVLAVGLFACGSSPSEPEVAVAATVDGEVITEDQVTAYIESIRAQIATTDEEWATALQTEGLTPDLFRQQIIDSFVEQILISKAAATEGITPDDAAIDGQIEEIKASVAAESEEAWLATLQQYGYATEQDLRDEIAISNLSEQLMTAKAPLAAPTQAEAEAYAVENAASLAGKRSSHILLQQDEGQSDEDFAALTQEVLEKVQAGEDFTTLAAEYSKDGSATSGGDVGWDKQYSFVTEYQSALDALAVGETSGLVVSEFGTHIIKCTEEFVVPADGALAFASIPEDLATLLAQQLEEEAVQEQQTAFQEYYDQLKAAAEVLVNPMPDGLPYDVDMTLAQAQSDTATTTE